MCDKVWYISLTISHTCVAQLFNKLMISLGYTEYVTQGGDWGHVVRSPDGQNLFGDVVLIDILPLADIDDSVQIRS